MTLFSESIFSTELISILKDILSELKRSNDLYEESNTIAREGNESFYKEQLINREIESEALEQASGINLGFKSLNRKVAEVEEVEDKQ